MTEKEKKKRQKVCAYYSGLKVYMSPRVTEHLRSCTSNQVSPATQQHPLCGVHAADRTPDSVSVATFQPHPGGSQTY